VTRYRFVAQYSGEYGVRRCCRAVAVSASSYYDWHRRLRHPGPRARADRALLGEIRRIHQASGGAYGAPRVHAELQIACGARVGRKRVARLMRTQGLVGCHRRKHWRPGSTRRDPKARPAADLVNRKFTTPVPDRIWHGDITELPTQEGTLYLAVLIDGCSRLAVGHAVGEHADAELAVAALELAVGRRGGVLAAGGGLICHTDQGGTYTAARFSKRLQRLGIRPSMGSVGDCFDHALVESFNATLECELIDRRVWQTKAQARLEVFHWIEATYNRARRHSSLGNLSPVDYEAMLAMTPTNSNPSR
jgi:transposase InsO family protein